MNQKGLITFNYLKMSKYNRSIKIAFDKKSGKILNADEVFDITKDAFRIREKYHEGNLDLSCCECGQDLSVSGSKYDRLHFKHKPGHNTCILSESSLSPYEHEKLMEILRGKESERHKELKHKIGELLKSVKGVDVDSIRIDSNFIIKDNERRKPDVYCKFQEKEVVFEIQLSDLSLSYILSRYNFYKKHGIYLIWVLNNFDIHNQSTLERDIKYLTKYENFFKLDEQSQTFKLVCDYKIPFLTADNKLLSKWNRKSVSLNELKFDNNIFQVFYYNYGDNFLRMESFQKQKVEEIEDAERKAIEKIKLRDADIKAKNIIKEIGRIRKQKVQDFNGISHEIHELDDFEVRVLKENLNLEAREGSPLIKWIDSAGANDFPFMDFIIRTKEIGINVNRIENGRTSFQALFENKNISYRNHLIYSLFFSGYSLTEKDNLLLSKLKDDNEDEVFESNLHLFKICNRLSNRDLVDDVLCFSRMVFIVESALKNEMIGYNFKGNKWVSFANNAIQHYSYYWEYIELAFKRYGLWNQLIESDKKGTFQKKLEAFYSKMPQQKYDFDNVFYDLYPDLEETE